MIQDLVYKAKIQLSHLGWSLRLFVTVTVCKAACWEFGSSQFLRMDASLWIFFLEGESNFTNLCVLSHWGNLDGLAMESKEISASLGKAKCKKRSFKVVSAITVTFPNLWGGKKFGVNVHSTGAQLLYYRSTVNHTFGESYSRFWRSYN